jgi:hypothetical protein
MAAERVCLHYVSLLIASTCRSLRRNAAVADYIQRRCLESITSGPMKHRNIKIARTVRSRSVITGASLAPRFNHAQHRQLDLVNCLSCYRSFVESPFRYVNSDPT